MGRAALFRNNVFKFSLLLVILAGCWYLGRLFKFDVPYYQTIFSGYPVAVSGLIFVLLYVGTTTFIWLGPKDILRISSAFFFGALTSTVFVWIGEMVNAFVMFHLSRSLGRDYVQQKLGVTPEKLEQMKDDASLLSVVAWRINPLFPFRLLDLGYGLSKIAFRKYFLGIVVISFFRILWLQYILAFLGDNLFADFKVVMEYLMGHPHIMQYSAFYFLAVIAVTILAVVARFFRKKRETDHGTSQ